LTENAISRHIVDAALRTHSKLGPGLLESVYQAVMAMELQKRGLDVVQQEAIPFVYEGTRFDIAFRADLIVQDCVIVEIKSIGEIAPCIRNNCSPI
jgi:GxxExxY protein